MARYDRGEKIQFNPHSLEDMIALMDTYGDSDTMFPGVNEDGETVWISIFPDKIVTSTLQRNNWTRKNIYYRDGSSEELYEK